MFILLIAKVITARRPFSSRDKAHFIFFVKKFRVFEKNLLLLQLLFSKNKTMTSLLSIESEFCSISLLLIQVELYLKAILINYAVASKENLPQKVTFKEL